MKKSEMFKKIAVVGLAATLVWGTVACGSTESSESAGTSESASLKVVKIGCGGNNGSEGLTESAAIAAKQGYFEEELNKVGYTAEYYGFAQAGPAINEAFAAKEIDVGFYADFPLLTAVSNDVGVVGFALANSEQNYAVFASNASGIESAKDLEGKQVIVGAGTILQKYFFDVVNEYNLDINKIGQINALQDAQTLIASGDADAIIYNHQAAIRLENAGLGHVVEDTTSQPEYSSAVVAAGRTEWLSENPEAAAAIVKAMDRAQKFAENDPDAAYAAMSSDSTPATVFQQTYSYDPSFQYFKPEITEEYLTRAQKIADFMFENSLIKKEIDVTSAFDNSYVEKALAE